MLEILVLYYSPGGAVAAMAGHLARGIETSSGVTARLRTVPRVAPIGHVEVAEAAPPPAPYVVARDLVECAGLALGCPTRFGTTPAALKFFLDGTSDIWRAGTLAGKPAAVFTSTGSLHGGQEATLLSMIVPLLHHGMIIVGIPYAGDALMTTPDGGTPYGASHVAGALDDRPISRTEKDFCVALGRRLAHVTTRLAS